MNLFQPHVETSCTRRPAPGRRRSGPPDPRDRPRSGRGGGLRYGEREGLQQGEGVSAPRIGRWGRLAARNAGSRTCVSYSGSNTRSDTDARWAPSGVKAGDSSRNLPSVASTTGPPPTGASRICRRPSGPGRGQASHFPSGEEARPETLPCALRSSSVTAPVAASTTRTRPSWAATARDLPCSQARRARPGSGARGGQPSVLSHLSQGDGCVVRRRVRRCCWRSARLRPAGRG